MSDGKINTGGAAFPCDPWAASEPKNVSEAKRLAEGMTLRDYFAAKAMQGLLAGTLESSDTGLIARDCYAMADAMLKAREA
jgi:hypothetical protein